MAKRCAAELEKLKPFDGGLVRPAVCRPERGGRKRSVEVQIDSQASNESNHPVFQLANLESSSRWVRANAQVEG